MKPRVANAQELFDSMPDRFRPDQALGLQATIQFDLSGAEGGHWYITIADQQARVNSGVTTQADLTYTATAADYLAVINREIDPFLAFQQGKVRVQGDMLLARKMQQLFVHDG